MYGSYRGHTYIVGGTYNCFKHVQFNIKSVMAAVESESFEAGCVKEQELALTLFTSGQARALQYAFFAERTAPKVGNIKSF